MTHATTLTTGLRWTAGLLLLLACAAAIAPARAAGDAALYGPTAPEGSAFIRVLNATDQADAEARIGPETIPDIPAWGVSDFTFVPEGTHSVSVGPASKSVTLKRDRYYTAVADAQGIRLLDNDRYGNRLKSLVILYNLTDRSGLSLRTADGKTPVVDSVEPNAFGTREVNAAKVKLAVFQGEQRVAETPPLNLVRGKAVSLFALGSADTPRLVWAVN